jgi:protein TonB
VKGSRHHPQSLVAAALTLIILLAFASAPTASSQVADPDLVQRRITRARALAAAGNLPAARSELESLRGVQTDESVKEIALVLLMGIYFEQSDYAYAEKLLDDAFSARSQQNEAATRAYYLLAGRAINGVRSQLDRYRAFGLDVSDQTLPEESARHLDRLRTLVEHIIAQGRQVRDESAHGIDAAALLESASSVRVLLARNETERAQWQREVADVRQRLTGVERSAPTQPALVVTQKPAPAQAVVGVTQAVPEPTPTVGAVATTTPAQTNTANPRSSGAQSSKQEGAHASAPAVASPRSSGGVSAQSSGASASGAQPVEVGSLIARASQTVAPTYPATARTARIGGKVTVYLLVDEKGEVAAVQRTEGPEMLRRAAEEAARHWKFRQTIINSQPVRVTGFVTFNFAP